MYKLRLALAGLLVAAATSLQAASVTFVYAARITQVNFDINDALVGSLVSGSYTFDSRASDDSTDVTVASYTMTGPPFGMTGSVPGASFATHDFLNITVAAAADGVRSRYAVLALSDDGGLSFDLLLQQSAGESVVGAPLPLDPPPIGMFDIRTLHIVENIAASQVQIDAELTALAAAPVPEPSAGLLLMAGLAVVGSLARFRLRPPRVGVQALPESFPTPHAGQAFAKELLLL